LKTLYIFVEIAIDPLHLALSVRRNFPSLKEAFRSTILERQSKSPSSSSSQSTFSSNGKGKGKGRIEVGIEIETPDHHADPTTAARAQEKQTKIALVSTVQFISAVHALRQALEESLPELPGSAHNDNVSPNPRPAAVVEEKASLLRIKAEEIGVWRGAYEIVIPQTKPLSPGEVLGCTAPKLDDDVDALMYVASSFYPFATHTNLLTTPLLSDLADTLGMVGFISRVS
jgi:2-(3-amino-3-carboxypropyl)histidine synthase